MSLTKSLIEESLSDSFPENLFILTSGALHVCYQAVFDKEKVQGLACFSTEASAQRFSSEWYEGKTNTISVTFEEAIEIAKTKPAVNCLLLCDNAKDPKMYFFR